MKKAEKKEAKKEKLLNMRHHDALASLIHLKGGCERMFMKNLNNLEERSFTMMLFQKSNKIPNRVQLYTDSQMLLTVCNVSMLPL